MPHIHVPAALYKQAASQAAGTGVSANRLIAQILEQHLDAEFAPQPVSLEGYTDQELAMDDGGFQSAVLAHAS